VWLVDGDDPVLVAEGLRSALDELVGTGDRSLVVEEFSGEDVDLGAVADACQTPPMLASRRVVVLRDAGRYSTEEAGPLLRYLEAPLASTVLVLVAGGGRIAPKLLAAARSTGEVRSTAVGRDGRAWFAERLRDAPVRLDPAAAQLLQGHLGEDLARLPALLDLLGAVHGAGARLGPDEVAPYLGAAGATAPWDLTDAIDAGDAERALTHLHRLLDGGQRHPLVVLAILHRHLSGLLRVDSPDISNEADAAAALGIAAGRSTFPAAKALRALRRWGGPAVGEGIELLAAAELDLKGARDLPGELVLEVLVARLCRLARSGQGPRRARRAGGR